MKLKNCSYFSYGMDSEENGQEYYYLQTASDGNEDFEICCSKHKYKPLIIGKILSIIYQKKLLRW